MTISKRERMWGRLPNSQADCQSALPSSSVRSSLLPFRYYGTMATRKTFSVPEPLAAQLLRRVASRDRSRFVSEAVAPRLEERDVALIRACEIANQDPDVAEIEKEFDGIRDEMAEPWKRSRSGVISGG
jgi:hypothetical protein